MAELSATKRALLARLCAGELGALPGAGSIPRDDSVTTAPLSFAQERIWLLHQLMPDIPIFNLRSTTSMPAAWESLCRKNFDQAVAQQDSLRTVFRVTNGVPEQVVLPHRGAAPDEVDLRGLPDDRAEREWEALVAQVGETPFDLTSVPPYRFVLARMPHDVIRLINVSHHIIGDGMSAGLLLRLAYRPEQSGPAVRYLDFARWQRARHAEGAFAAVEAHWGRVLAELPEPVRLPTDRRVPAVPTHRGARYDLVIEGARNKEVREYARGNGFTVFSLLLAAFDVLLMRYTGRTDVVVGSTVLGRDRPELQDVVGTFADTVPLRARIGEDTTFRDLVVQVQDATRDAMGYQGLPFEYVLARHGRAGTDGRLSFFPIVFNMPPATGDPVTLGMLDFVSDHGYALRFDMGSGVQYDLHLMVYEFPDELRIQWVYATDLFDEATIERMAGHYARLLSMAVTEPGRPVGRLEMLSPEENRGMGSAGSGSGSSKTLLDLFTEQVDRCPAAIAIEAGDRQLTYEELNAAAEGVAARLRAHGAGRETLVGVCLDRSVELVVGLLAVLKSGGAYVPLDPDLPAQRLAYLTADAGLELVISTEPDRGLFPGTEVIDVSGSDGVDEPLPPIPAPDGDQLAYVVYTSGSTGNPKGVAITHRSLAALLCAVRGDVGTVAGTTLLALTTISFDIAALELFLPLASGGRVVLAPRQGLADGEELAKLLSTSDARIVQATPSLWRLLLEAGDVDLAGITVLCGGEALVPALAERLVARGARLWNMYGPTETTIWSARRQVTAPVDPDRATVPLGDPLAGTTLHVLDGRLAAVPRGAVGELYIGGVGLARGYHGAPGMTAQRFLPNPFGAAGSRLYRTGDRVRLLPDGDLEFLGRGDHQVKISGVRVELAEVEDALTHCPGVRAAAAAAVPGPDGALRLVGYLVLSEGAGAEEVDRVREALVAILPRSLLPEILVCVDSLPLTPNGKLDRSALTAVESVAGPVREYVAPRSPTEQLLARAMADVLDVDRVGATDDFFALGAASMAALRLVNRIQETLRIKVPMRQIFLDATVAGLARWCDGATTEGSVPDIRHVPRREPQPLSFAQQSIWFATGLDPDGSAYTVVEWRHQDSTFEPEAFDRAVRLLTARHDQLRTRFTDHGDEPYQYDDDAVEPRVEVVDADGDSSRVVREATLRAAATRFDLEQAGLFRVIVVRHGEAGYTVVLAVHHIVIDGPSVDTLLRELAATCAALRRGEQPRLPELPTRYVDFAAWQRDRFRGPYLDNRVAWWREQLAGAPPRLELPADFVRPAAPTLRGNLLPIRLSAASVRALRELSRAENVTPFMLLQAVFQLLLFRYTGNTDLIVGVPVTHRGHLGFNGVLGIFVDTALLRGRPRADMPFRELLREVSRSVVDTLDNDLPFQLLAEHVMHRRDTVSDPLFQVMFDYQEVDGGHGRLDDSAQLGPVPLAAKCELSFALFGHGDTVTGYCVYRTELFEDESIARLVEHFVALVDAATADPAARLADLPMSSAAGQRRYRPLEADR